MGGAPCPLATGCSMACRFGGALLGSNGSSSSGGLLMGMSSSASGDRLESMALSGLSSDIDTGQRTRPGDKCSDARRHHLSMAHGLLQVDEVGFDEGSWVSVRRVWVAKLPASVPSETPPSPDLLPSPAFKTDQTSTNSAGILSAYVVGHYIGQNLLAKLSGTSMPHASGIKDWPLRWESQKHPHQFCPRNGSDLHCKSKHVL